MPQSFPLLTKRQILAYRFTTAFFTRSGIDVVNGVYGGNNKRVKQGDGKTSYSFYGANDKRMYRFEHSKHVDSCYLAGKLTAKRKSYTITYLHSDFLGSPAAESSSAGAVERCFRIFGLQVRFCYLGVY